MRFSLRKVYDNLYSVLSDCGYVFGCHYRLDLLLRHRMETQWNLQNGHSWLLTATKLSEGVQINGVQIERQYSIIEDDVTKYFTTRKFRFSFDCMYAEPLGVLVLLEKTRCGCTKLQFRQL